MTKDITNRKEFIRELSLRTGYSHRVIKEILYAMADIIADAVTYKHELRVRGLFTLYYKIVEGYNGVNAYKTRMLRKAGDMETIVREDFADSYQAILRLPESIRKMVKDGLEVDENDDDTTI